MFKRVSEIANQLYYELIKSRYGKLQRDKISDSYRTGMANLFSSTIQMFSKTILRDHDVQTKGKNRASKYFSYL